MRPKSRSASVACGERPRLGKAVGLGAGCASGSAVDTKSALKELMIRELNLANRTPDDIVDDAPLFGPGVGNGLSLDSLDALQLAMAIEERFGVKIPEGDGARSIFASVDALAAHIDANLPAKSA